MTTHLQLLPFLSRVPKRYLEGPWDPFTYVILLACFIMLLLTFEEALKDGNFSSCLNASCVINPSLQLYQFIGGIYCLFVLSWIFYRVGFGPLVSYTVISFSILSLRLLSVSLSPYSSHLLRLSHLLRFPSLIGNTVTFFVWWVVLVPLVYYLLDAEAKRKFTAFNKTFTLINVHCVNFLLASGDFFTSGVRLSHFDLYLGFLFGFMYVLFYLFFLDSRGLHLYIIFTPRTPWVVLSYTFMLSFYYLAFRFYNYHFNFFFE